MEPRFETFEHGADIGVRGFGPTRESAFEQVALALTSVITDPAGVATRVPVQITCNGPDDELLLLSWLNAVVYEMATRHMLFSGYRVQIREDHLSAEASGETVDVGRHQPAVEVKGATCTELEVSPSDNGSWLAQCVVDV